MKYYFCLAVLCVSTFCGGRIHAQKLIPLKYLSEDDNRMIAENDSVTIYAATADSGHYVTINEELLFYKLVDKKNKSRIDAEGSLVADGEGYLQQGRWVQYYSNGKVAIAGNYHKGQPFGKWLEFYPEGGLRLAYQYAVITDMDGTSTCLSGSFEEFYKDGKIKVSGFYAADRNRKNETIAVDDPVAGNTVNKAYRKSYYVPQKAGYWEYYSETGEVEKREEF